MAPIWIVRLLERVVHPADQDEVVGDFEEVHRRRKARWGSVLSYAGSILEGLALITVHAFRALRSTIGAGGCVSWLEVRLALRLVRKQPVMTLTSVLAIGTGIGIAAGGVSVVRQALFSEFPFENGDRWVVIETYSEETGRRTRLDLERLQLFRASAPSLEYIGGAESVELNVVHADGRIERTSGARITPRTFSHLPYAPLAGRLLNVEDGRTMGDPVALIRESLWERMFGRDLNAVGRTIDIAGEVHLIVGVLPDDAGYPSDGEIWLPLDEATMGARSNRDRLPGTRQPALMAAGTTPDEARAQLERLSAAVVDQGRGVEPQRYAVTPITATMATGQAQMLAFLTLTVLAAVLAVIAANVANLIVARTSRRASELAVRTALGASRARIVVQLCVEILAIGLPGAMLGLGLAGGILSMYDRVLDELPFWVHLKLDSGTAVAVVVLTLFASAVMGLVPALRMTHAEPSRALHEAGGRSRHAIGRFGGAMIVSEVALSVALLGVSVVFADGFRAYVDPEVHLPDDRVLTARITMEGSDSTLSTLDRLGDALSTLPGVRAVGFASHLPRAAPFPDVVDVEGRSDLVRTAVAYQGPHMFEVLDVEPLLGRDLEELDLDRDAPRVVVVNQAFAVETFGTAQVLGRRIRLAPEADEAAEVPWSTIVGVVPNVMEVTAPGRGSAVYFPLTGRRFVSVALLVDGEPVALTGLLRRAAFDLDPSLDVSQIVRLDDVGAENRSALQVMASALMAIGLTTLVLALAGVYSIVSLAVTKRTREIGVRVALGAEPGAILWSVLRRSGFLVLTGTSIGTVAGVYFSKMRPFVFALPEPRQWLFPTLVGSMAVAGLLACWVPARRALSIQPNEALQHD